MPFFEQSVFVWRSPQVPGWTWLHPSYQCRA